MSPENTNNNADVKEVSVSEIYKPLSETDLEAMQAQIDAWKKQHKDKVIFIEVPGTATHETFNGIFRVPTKMDMESAARADKKGIDSDADLARLCVLYPDPIVFNLVLQRDWGIVTPIARKLISECQLNSEASIKKL